MKRNLLLDKCADCTPDIGGIIKLYKMDITETQEILHINFILA